MENDIVVRLSGLQIPSGPISSPNWQQIEKYLYLSYEESVNRGHYLQLETLYDPEYSIGKWYTSNDIIELAVEDKLFRLNVFFSNQEKEGLYLWRPKKQLDIPDWVVIDEDKTPRCEISDDIEKAVSFFREFFETGTVTLDEFELY